MPNEIAMPQQAGRGAVECDDAELEQVRGGSAFDAFLYIDGVKAPGPDSSTEGPGIRTGAITPRRSIGG